jgi:hypothetical protein
LRLDGRYLHQDWARGEGYIVRHLCGDNRCLNPIHLVRGSEIENALDEIDVRNFMLSLFKDHLKDRSVDDYPNEVQWLVMVPRMQRWYWENREINYSFSDIRVMWREDYRKYKSYEISKSITDELLYIAREKLKWLYDRRDIEIQPINNLY